MVDIFHVWNEIEFCSKKYILLVLSAIYYWKPTKLIDTGILMGS